MARPRGNFGRRIEKEWNNIPGITLALTAAATVSGSAFIPGTSITIMRMLGEYMIVNTGTIVAADGARVTVGIGVVSADAFAAGAASLPDPDGEPEYPWLYWASHSFRFPKALSATISGDSVSGVIRRPFDIKSMRKMKPGQALVFIVQYADISGNPALTMEIAPTRLLVGGV